MDKKIFSGVQPTGNLHLGNYLGAIKNFVALNKNKANECILCVSSFSSFIFYQLIQKFNEYLMYESEYKLLTIVLLVIITILIYIITSIFTKAFKISDIKLKY